MTEPISRRRALTLGVLGIGAIAAGATGLVVGTRSTSEPPSAGPDTGWPQPRVLTSENGVLEVDLDVAETDVTIGDSTIRMLTYNGSAPGPTLHLHPGDRLRIHLHNGLDQPTNLHTHGLDVSATGNSDNPFLRIDPGGAFDYEIDLPADHPAGVCWYHPHHHGMVAEQLFGGLYGAIIVDEEDWSTTAPLVAVISDATFTDGRVADVSPTERIAGRTGDTLMTNGQITPAIHAPAGSNERLLVINACSSRYLDLQLGNLDAQLRGRDSVRLGEPAAIDRLLLVPGNRVDLVVTVPTSTGDLIAATYDRGHTGMGMMGGQSTISPEATVLSVVPDAQAPARVVAPAASTPLPDLRDRVPDARRTLTLSMGGGMGGEGMGMRFLMDDRSFDPNRIDQSIPIGTVEEWTIVNQSPMNHPFHLHVWPMQMVRAGGSYVSGVEVRDVIDIPARQSITVRIAFDRFPGTTVYHCHILDHEDLGMMGVLRAR
ncbi:multicopper oxidase family protein [Gordonia sp. Z-3]|uniref:multicopper oxidase family protein n=1 Tax=Gordonia sp. Z-3 TaxID=3115408 RepID=UPI002E28E859|nr:multicopper oxidase family protein [Gordonia sp. Z-3]MED5801833.1 multicopper oxidase family protein [Gordonia sp. Z-3]